MIEHKSRRTFFSRLAAGLAAYGIGNRTAPAQAQTANGAVAPFQPARHPEDGWLDGLSGQHRIFFDARSPRGTGEAIAFATNTFIGNKNGYGLDDEDVAIVICLRHFATPFAYNDTIWNKYGAAMAGFIEFDDPKTKKAPTMNVYNTPGFDDALPNRNVTLDGLARRGVHFAICGLATRRLSSIIAKAHGISADDTFKELSANLLANGHLVAAGVVASNRAQERGYSFIYVG